MAKERFKDVNFRGASLAMIFQINRILDRYAGEGLRLTLRQLYYQLVVTNAIQNKERSYKNLGNLVSDGRLAGLIDWDAIEDRVRQPRMHAEFDNLRQLSDAALRSWRLPRWDDQDNYVELWVEKDALSGVLWPLANEFHVTLMVNRGYSSQSAMKESAERIRAQGGKSCYVVYLGDHDPSGEDMVRDVRDRLAMFGVEVEVEKLALTRAQVDEYAPPPNPAKMSDSRASAYVAEHGAESWEVDALPPDVLQKLIRARLEDIVDRDRMDAVIVREAALAKRFRSAVEKVDRG